MEDQTEERKCRRGGGVGERKRVARMKTDHTAKHSAPQIVAFDTHIMNDVNGKY